MEKSNQSVLWQRETRNFVSIYKRNVLLRMCTLHFNLVWKKTAVFLLPITIFYFLSVTILFRFTFLTMKFQLEWFFLVQSLYFPSLFSEFFNFFFENHGIRKPIFHDRCFPPVLFLLVFSPLSIFPQVFNCPLFSILGYFHHAKVTKI